MKTRILTPSIIVLLFLIFLAPQNLSASNVREVQDIRLGYEEASQIHPFFPDNDFSVDEKTWVWHSFEVYKTTKNQIKDLLPFEVKIYLDDQEIKIKRFTEVFPNQYYHTNPGPDHWFGEKGTWIVKSFAFYQIFDPGYFESGQYEWTVQWYSNHNLINTGITTLTFY